MSPRFALGFALALVACSLGEPTDAQTKGKDEKALRTLIVVVDDLQLHQMKTRKLLRFVNDKDGKAIVTLDYNEKDRTVKVTTDDKTTEKLIRLAPATDDPSILAITGLAPGQTRIICVDKDGAKEIYDVVVRSEVFVPVDKSDTVQLSSKKAIKKISNDGEKIIRVEKMADDATTVKVSGLASGDTRFTLTDEDGATETFEAAVRSDTKLPANTLAMTLYTREVIPLGKQPYKGITNRRPAQLQILPVTGDPTSVAVVALKPGLARFEVTDPKGVRKKYEMLVRADGPLPKDNTLLMVGEEYRPQLPKAKGKRSVRFDTADKDIKVGPDAKDENILVISFQREGGFDLAVIDEDGTTKNFHFVVRKEKPDAK